MNPSRYPDEKLDKSIAGLMRFQACLLMMLLGAVLIMGQWRGWDLPYYLGSTAYGGILVIIGTWMLARSVKRMGDIMANAPERVMPAVAVGMLVRLVMVAGGLAFGLIVLKFQPVAMLVGFVVLHIARIGFGLKYKIV